MTGETQVTWDQPIGSIGRLRFAPPPFVNWAFTVAADGATYLVDTGNPGQADDLIACLKRKGVSIDHILLTHHHPTHAANAAATAEAFGAHVWAHKGNAPLCRADGIAIDRTFDSGDVIGGALTVIEAPGHAPGNVAFYVAEVRIMLAGDVVMGLGPSEATPLCLPGPHAEASSEEVAADARRLLDYDFDTCLPAHGRHVETSAKEHIRRILG